MINPNLRTLALALDTLIGDSDDHSACKIADYDRVLNRFGLIYEASPEIEAYDRARRLELMGLTNDFVSAKTGKSSDISIATKVERRVAC